MRGISCYIETGGKVIMKKMVSVALVLVMLGNLAGCGSSDAGGSTDPAAATASQTAETQAETETPAEKETSEEAEAAFSEKSIPVVRDRLDSTETAAVRYYEDQPDIPYMSVTDFYNQFYLVNTELDEGMTFKQDGSKYTVTNFCGDNAVFDADTDTIEIDNMERFIKLACDLQSADNEGLHMDPDYPYAMITHKLDPEEATPKTLDLAGHDIDLRGDDTGVYAPLPTLADIFASASGYYVVYAGEKIYVRDFVGLYLDSVMEDDPEYFEAIKSERTESMAQYTYNELCFNMDLWYGKPGQEYIHEDLLNGKLDDVLTAKYPQIKERLLAKDFETFYGGLINLFAGLLFDGGHTGMACNALMDDEFELSTGFFKEARAEDYGVTYNRYADRIGHGALREEAREAIYNGDYYVEKGETAIICFNKFVVDNDAWRAFYAGEGERPLVVEDPETGGETYDSVGVMLAGLERAAKNPKIKNIIIDNTCNGGGNDIAMLAVEWLTTGKGYIRDRNEITGQFNTKEEIFDFNQDGKIDDSDVSPYTDYHYGVLTSDGSFSCGNAFPFFMHEHGAMILGEKSSGGACGVRLSSVGGIEVQNSAASSCTVTEEGETVDNGCPVDVELTSDGENPYDNFYNLSILSEQMNKYFDEVQKGAA